VNAEPIGVPWWRRAWVRWAVALLVVVAVLVRVGVGPVRDGLAAVDARSAALATVIGLLTTLGAALRWRLVARGLGLVLPLRAAVAGCYRSQFLNSVLPGGVLGDVHRGVRHGTEVAAMGRAVRAVAWERSAGQVVQVVISVVVVLLVGSRSAGPALWTGAAVAVLLAAVIVVAALASWRSPGGRVAGVVRTMRVELRHGVLSRRALPGVLAGSALVVAGCVATFWIAARVTGVTAPVAALVPLALVVLLAMAVPLNVAGWGPREGVAAWAFAAAGFGAAQGVAASVAYGVLAFVAALPGAAVLLSDRIRPAVRSGRG
jgi:uncharacterized membrane protein YbhN (UPF0104 family)